MNRRFTRQSWSVQQGLAYTTLISILDGTFPYDAEVVPRLLMKLNYDVMVTKSLVKIREEALFLIKKSQPIYG